jgi:lysozyme
MAFCITLIALLAIVGIARIGTRPTPSTAAEPFPTPTPTVVGVMGAGLRRLPPAAPVAAASAVCPSGTPLQGIDVSYYQGSFYGGSINWSQVAQSGRAFAYARAADGTTFVDPDFLANYAGIKAAGMKAGAYLFYRPDEDPKQQAYVLISELDQAYFAPGDLVPVLDVEVTDGVSSATIVANLQTTIATVQQSLGVTPAIYTSWGFWNGSVGSTAFGTDPLWVANWGVTCPTLPTGWSTWAVWQYNDNSTVPGITVNVVDADESPGPALPLDLPIRRYFPLVLNQARAP